MGKLNDNQKKFMIAMLSSKTIAEATKKAGISAQTGYNYMNDQSFKRELKAFRRAKFEQATSKIVDSVDEAVEVLRSVMNDDEEVGATRVQAARTIIANAFKSYELQEIEERLENIEQLLAEQGGD